MKLLTLPKLKLVKIPFVIDCSETFWEYMIFSEPEAPYADLIITINPINGKVTDVHGNRETSN
jgi:hypothetical protein